MESQEAALATSQYFCNFASFRNHLLGVLLRSMAEKLNCSKSLAILTVLVCRQSSKEKCYGVLGSGVSVYTLIPVSVNLGN